MTILGVVTLAGLVSALSSQEPPRHLTVEYRATGFHVNGRAVEGAALREVRDADRVRLIISFDTMEILEGSVIVSLPESVFITLCTGVRMVAQRLNGQVYFSLTTQDRAVRGLMINGNTYEFSPQITLRLSARFNVEKFVTELDVLTRYHDPTRPHHTVRSQLPDRHLKIILLRPAEVSLAFELRMLSPIQTPLSASPISPQ